LEGVGRYKNPSHCSQCRLSRRLAQDEVDATTSKRQQGQKSKVKVRPNVFEKNEAFLGIPFKLLILRAAAT